MAVARKDKAFAAVKNYMNTFAIPYYDKNGSRSQNVERKASMNNTLLNERQFI